MDALHVEFILYYVFGVLSIIGNLFVALSLMRIGLLSSPTKLVLYLHLTLVLENLTTFPNVYSNIGPFCEFIAVVRTYSGMANSFVVVSLVLLYRYWFVEDSWKIIPFMSKYRELLIFGIPLLSLLPLSTNSYGSSHEYFCTLRKSTMDDKIWAGLLYVCVVAVTITLSFAIMVHTVVHVFMTDSRYAKSLFRSVGFYAIFSILTWIPRSLAQVGVLSYLSTFYLTYISGILYVLIFIYEKEYFQAYERNTAWNTDLQEGGDRDSGYFSWDISNLSSYQSSKSLHQAAGDRPQQRGSATSLREKSATFTGSRSSMQRRSIKMEGVSSASSSTGIPSSTSNPILSNGDDGSTREGEAKEEQQRPTSVRFTEDDTSIP